MIGDRLTESNLDDPALCASVLRGLALHYWESIDSNRSPQEKRARAEAWYADAQRAATRHLTGEHAKEIQDQLEQAERLVIMGRLA